MRDIAAGTPRSGFTMRVILRWSTVGAMCVAMLAAATATAADGRGLAAVLACRAIESPPARLACYDRATAALRTVAAKTAPPRARPLNPRKTFGLPEAVVAEKEVAAGVRAPPVARLRTNIAGLSRTGDGRIVFRLSNGQVWRELLPGSDLLVRVGDPVVISRGWLGSYWLKLANGEDCKVDRLR